MNPAIVVPATLTVLGLVYTVVKDAWFGLARKRAVALRDARIAEAAPDRPPFVRDAFERAAQKSFAELYKIQQVDVSKLSSRQRWWIAATILSMLGGTVLQTSVFDRLPCGGLGVLIWYPPTFYGLGMVVALGTVRRVIRASALETNDGQPIEVPRVAPWRWPMLYMPEMHDVKSEATPKRSTSRADLSAGYQRVADRSLRDWLTLSWEARKERKRAGEAEENS